EPGAEGLRLGAVPGRLPPDAIPEREGGRGGAAAGCEPVRRGVHRRLRRGGAARFPAWSRALRASGDQGGGGEGDRGDHRGERRRDGATKRRSNGGAAWTAREAVYVVV